MCGIAGVLGLQSGEAATAVQAMLRAMVHRGPDGTGTLAFTGGAAGMVRLALVDPTPRGQQPLWSPDRKVAILFNGEMYNFKEERARLQAAGAAFTTGSDTEVVLALYLEQGDAFVARVRGMFALAIFDFRAGETPRVLLARDPLGIKPLYIYEKGGLLAFSSEVRALLAAGQAPRQLSTEAVRDFLTYGFVAQPRTILQDVRMLDCATLEVHAPDGTVTARRYWEFPAAEPVDMTRTEAAEELRAILRRTVRLHAFADVPVGAFLSGGVDSTGVVAMMREVVPRVRTYTLRFPELPGADEVAEARAIAAALDVEHNIVDVTNAEAAAALPLFAAQIDQPSIDGFNTWLVSRGAARDVKGVLSGLGGDEWFSGYPVARRLLRQATTRQGRVESLLGMVAARALSAGLPAAPFVGDTLRTRAANLAARRSAATLWAHSHSVFSPHDTAALLGDATPRASYAGFAREVAHAAPRGPLAFSCDLDARVYMVSQLLRDSDATSMAHSLELRVPFVDVEVATFARRCPDHLKLESIDGEAKRVLSDALDGVSPPSVRTRKKRGFDLPFAAWMTGPMRDVVEDSTGAASVTRRGLVDPQRVAALRSGTDPRAQFPKLWALMILELWTRAVVDDVPAALAEVA